MINRTRCLFYEVKGVFYKNLAQAQKADLLSIIPDAWEGANGEALNKSDARVVVADWLLKNAEAVALILTTTPRSRIRKPWKDKGVPRKKPNLTPTTDPPSAP